MIKSKLEKIISDHLRTLNMKPPGQINVEHPKAKEHGDYSTNVAMILAGGEKKNPREVAQAIAASLEQETVLFEQVEIKGPGFINFFLKPAAYHEALRTIWNKSGELELTRVGAGKRVLVEFVSANPTGPMHVGHGRNAVVGDCLARLLEAVGFEVAREFYVNDHGVQIQTLGVSGSHYHRVLTRVGGVQAALPDDMYRGAYLEELVDQIKDRIRPVVEDPLAVGKLLGVELLKIIQKDLQSLNISFDHYFSESSLYESGKIDKVLDILKKTGNTYEKDGALWFRTTDFGDDKDRVLIKSDNTYTYLTPDVAYHRDKFERNYDHYINVMGADHGGYVKRLKASVKALGNDPDRLEFLLMQLVNLKRGEESVGMSKRSGDYVTLREVVEEVGRDAARFFFMMRSHNAALDFDLDLAKKETPENPVFYIQYAHARMCSIFRKAEEAGYPPPDEIGDTDLSPLNLPEDMELIKTLLTYPELLIQAAQLREPHRVAFYLLDLARTFQNYYTRGKTNDEYRFFLGPVVLKSAGGELSVELKSKKEKREVETMPVLPKNIGDLRQRGPSTAKLFLVKTLREIFRHGLGILGVSAPERMRRED